MRRVAALLAAALALAATGCGSDGGAEPGAPNGASAGPREASLILDFRPNAVHAGIYSALARDIYVEAGVDLRVREPGASTDAPKLLRTGRAEFAILDIHDLAIAREAEIDVVGIGAIVQRPLAAVIAADRNEVRRPADLAGREVGVTGLPSDEAVLDSVLEADGVDPEAVERVTIGFESVPALSAGRIAAATAFWSAEGVQLARLGLPTREFRVDRFGAPAYPELVLATSSELLEQEPELVEAVFRATARGYELTLAEPRASLGDLLAEVPDLDRATELAQLRALLPVFDPPLRLDPQRLREWAEWDAEHGIVERRPNVEEAFALELSEEG